MTVHKALVNKDGDLQHFQLLNYAKTPHKELNYTQTLLLLKVSLKRKCESIAQESQQDALR